MKFSNIAFAAMMALPFAAQAHPGDETHAAAPATTAAPAALAAGEVKKVDKEAGKLTIKHAPLVNLDMPAMTMAFRVKDAAMLDAVKPGDKINFAAERVNGMVTITRIEAEK